MIALLSVLTALASAAIRRRIAARAITQLVAAVVIAGGIALIATTLSDSKEVGRIFTGRAGRGVAGAAADLGSGACAVACRAA